MAKNKKDEEHEIVLIGEKISKIPSSKVGFICIFLFYLSSILEYYSLFYLKWEPYFDLICFEV